jgi:glycolate oxidase
MEVVLPTGEVTRIGSCAVTDSWCNRPPLPDLVGLFVGWQGATGVVTKISLQLWPRHPFKHIRAVFINGVRPACELARKLGQTRICEIIECWTFEDVPIDVDKAKEVNKGKQQGSISMRGERVAATYDRPPGPSTLSVVSTLAADSQEEMDAKISLLDVVIKRELEGVEWKELPREMIGLTDEDLPVTGSAPLGGLTWVGSMGPTSRWADALEKINTIYDKHRLRRGGIMVPFRQGHWGMLRLVVQYHQGDPDEVERVKKCMQEIAATALDHGFIPYKAPYWAVAEMMKRGDPNWVSLLGRVKNMLDPNNIMNPGRYGNTES